MSDKLSRRSFLQQTSLGGAFYLMPHADSPGNHPYQVAIPQDLGGIPLAKPLDLSPAKWIWFPSRRCLQNTFILFRRQLSLPQKPDKATGYLFGDSRYLLEVNGKRVQWGPAPCDPRYQEADPVDLTNYLQAGDNVIAVTVLYYGQGDGTWPMGKPGFIFKLDIAAGSGKPQTIISDKSWSTFYARAWRPGQYKRWFLRALQEEFDARNYPYGWNELSYQAGDDWLPALELRGPADKPSVCTNYHEYQWEIWGDKKVCELRGRVIPQMDEQHVPAKQLTESMWIRWNRLPEEYFECLTPGSHEAVREPSGRLTAPGVWEIEPRDGLAAALTFEFGEQIVGWPYFTIEASEGTVVDLMVQESHKVGGPALLNTHFHSWGRFTCREGMNTFETFDYESLRWLQLHVRNAKGPVKLSEVGVRRRKFPWPHQPQFRCSDNKVQRVMEAAVNTLHNSAQEIVVDGMGRERQQYSGDGGHQLHAIYYAFGESRLPARYMSTFSQGMTKHGFFLDSWPAYDRLARLIERQMDLTGWGPLLDHGTGFNFDCFYYYQYTGDRDGLNEAFPRLLQFFNYLTTLPDQNGLMPVKDLGVPSVWIDHQAYKEQRQKQCAFNLYVAAMCQHALAPLCRVFEQDDAARKVLAFGKSILEATVKRFWSDSHGMFVNNLPWMAEDGHARLCDRSLATSVIFDQCPGQQTGPAVEALVTCPDNMGFSYPCNATWRYWALAKGKRIDVVLQDFRTRWYEMNSVQENNTLQEFWDAPYDSHALWSHCAVSPLFVLYMDVAGIRPLQPGFSQCRIQPQPGDLEELSLVAHTVKGPIHFAIKGKTGKRNLRIKLPEGCQAELVVAAKEKLKLKEQQSADKNNKVYQLDAGQSYDLRLRYT